MKNFNLLLATTALFVVTGCVKPAQETQAIYNEPATQPATQVGTQSTVYNDPTQPIYTDTTTTQPIIYEDAQQPIVYGDAGTTYGTPATSGVIYEDVIPATTTTTTSSYPDPYAVNTSTATTSYPDPYAGNTGSSTSYPDPYAGGQQVLSDYPASTPASSSVVGGGIHLQIAALKNYRTAENYKNRLSLAPGMTAYVQRGAMNKVIVSGISSVAEANRLKQTRFPGAFIVKGGTSSGYTPPVQPNYSTGGYTVDTPYGSSSSSSRSSGRSGVGVQIGAYGSKGKAQSVANNQSSRYPAVVRKIGKYYKVILTGFSSRSAAKSHASRVGGFVVSSF